MTAVSPLYRVIVSTLTHDPYDWSMARLALCSCIYLKPLRPALSVQTSREYTAASNHQRSMLPCPTVQSSSCGVRRPPWSSRYRSTILSPHLTVLSLSSPWSDVMHASPGHPRSGHTTQLVVSLERHRNRRRLNRPLLRIERACLIALHEHLRHHEAIVRLAQVQMAERVDQRSLHGCQHGFPTCPQALGLMTATDQAESGQINFTLTAC